MKQKLTRQTRERFNFYYIFDETNNEASKGYTTFREARKEAFTWLKGLGSTVIIFSYRKNGSVKFIAREEDF